MEVTQEDEQASDFFIYSKLNKMCVSLSGAALPERFFSCIRGNKTSCF